MLPERLHVSLNKDYSNSLKHDKTWDLQKERGTKRKKIFPRLKKMIKVPMDIEIYIGTIKNNLQKVLGKWSPLYNNQSGT